MTGAPRIDRIESMAANWLINGDMRLSQRGTYTSATAASTSTYYLDRWAASFSTVTATVQQVTTSQPPALSGSNSLKMAATSSATGYLGVFQRVEDYLLLAGRTVTVSMLVRSNSSSARLWSNDVSGTGTLSPSSTHSGGGGWELLTYTFTIGAATAGPIYIGCSIISSVGGTLAITSGQYIEITGACLAIGNVANFSPRPYGQELLLAQRYYERGFIRLYWPTGGTSYAAFPVSYKTEKRATPVLKCFDGAATVDRVNIMYNTSGNQSTGNVASYSENNLKDFLIAYNAGGTCYGLLFTWTSDAEI